MAVAIVPNDILERAAFKLHLPTFASGNFVTDAHALMLLKESCERLSGLLLNSYGSQHFARQATVSTQAGVDVVSLPAGLATIEGVYWLAPDDRAVQLQHAYRLDEDLTPRAWDTAFSARSELAPAYRVEGNTLVLRPVPSALYSIRIDYQATPTITALTDTIYGQAGWADWLVWDVMAQILDREDKSLKPDQLLRWQKTEADIKSQGANRDKGARPQAVDAYGAFRRDRRDWRYRGL